MIEVEKFHNHRFNLEEILITSQDELSANQFLIRSIFFKDIQKDRLTILINTLVNRGLLVPSERLYNYRPEHFILKMDDLKIATLSECSTFLERYLVILIDIFTTSNLAHTDIKMKWVINTLIEHNVLENVFDPMNKQAKNFKELFEA